MSGISLAALPAAVGAGLKFTPLSAAGFVASQEQQAKGRMVTEVATPMVAGKFIPSVRLLWR
jgi:hypothetical protein